MKELSEAYVNKNIKNFGFRFTFYRTMYQTKTGSTECIGPRRRRRYSYSNGEKFHKIGTPSLAGRRNQDTITDDHGFCIRTSAGTPSIATKRTQDIITGDHTFNILTSVGTPSIAARKTQNIVTGGHGLNIRTSANCFTSESDLDFTGAISETIWKTLRSSETRLKDYDSNDSTLPGKEPGKYCYITEKHPEVLETNCSRVVKFLRRLLTKTSKERPKRKERFPAYKPDRKAMTNADPCSQSALTLEHLVIQTPYGFSTLKSRPMTMCSEAMFH